MTEPLTNSFIMHGARDAIAGGLAHIGENVYGIEKAVVEEPGLAFDLAKTLVESVCRTVLKERSLNYDDADNLPKLFKTTTRHLPFLPTMESDKVEVRQSLDKTLSGVEHRRTRHLRTAK